MKRIIFTNPTAQKLYDDYFARVTRCVSILSPADQQELLMELNSHVYEATHRGIAGNEVDILVDALDKLDYPVVMGSVLFSATFFIIMNILADLLYGVVDPRVRLN